MKTRSCPRHIVCTVRNTLEYESNKGKKIFAKSLKAIYQAADKKEFGAMKRASAKRDAMYSNTLKSRENTRMLSCQSLSFR